ncbi:MAG: 2'-deoxycytidine 5'-triphosphate deaminase domain-containing protein, partial [Pseudooceanicola sp.]
MTGICASQRLESMIAEGLIRGEPEVTAAQVQPASLDLRLGTRAWRVRASFLAGEGRSVASRLAEFEMHQVDLSDGAVLEKGCVYVVPLMESLSLPPG